MILADTLPTPDKASLIRFLLTCPMLQRLSAPHLEPLASRLQMKRYADGAQLLNHAPHREMPLRVVVHGQASWEPSSCAEQRGAWMLSAGSVFGLGAVNDWAHERGLPGTWTREDLDSVSCKSAGALTVLELAPEHFEEAFTHEQAHLLCCELLCMFATVIHAPQVVAALRQTPQFGRVSTPKLYRLLERAPTLDYLPEPTLVAEQPVVQVAEQAPGDAIGPQGQFVTDPAMYHVLEGELLVNADDHMISLHAGELGGPDLFDTSPLVAKSAAKAMTPAKAVVLTQRALFDMMRCDPGITRSLGPRGFGKVVSP